MAKEINCYLVQELESLERDYGYFLDQYGYDREMSDHLASIRRTLDKLKTGRVSYLEQTGKSKPRDYIS